MSDNTQTVTSTDNTPVNPKHNLTITNKPKREVVSTNTRTGVDTYANVEDDNGKTVYGDAFIVVTTDPDFKHPPVIKMDKVKEISAEKVNNEEPFKYAGSEKGSDEALCYELRGEVTPFPQREVTDKMTGEVVKEPKKFCGNYYPVYPRVPIKPTTVSLG